MSPAVYYECILSALLQAPHVSEPEPGVTTSGAPSLPLPRVGALRERRAVTRHNVVRLGSSLMRLATSHDTSPMLVICRDQWEKEKKHQIRKDQEFYGLGKASKCYP